MPDEKDNPTLENPEPSNTEDSQQTEPRAEDNTTTAIDGIPVTQDFPPELLAKMPPETRRELIMFLSHQRIGSPANPIATKITSEHVTQIIENAEAESQRSFKSQWFSLGYAVLALIFLVFFFIYLPGVDVELFKETLKLLLTFLGGLGAGFGVARYKTRK